MDPGEPAVRAQTLRVMLDVVRRYDVDGIHIDDYFYPYPEIGPDSAPIPFPDSVSYARYVKGGGKLELNDWRRENVNILIRDIYRRTKQVRLVGRLRGLLLCLHGDRRECASQRDHGEDMAHYFFS